MAVGVGPTGTGARVHPTSARRHVALDLNSGPRPTHPEPMHTAIPCAVLRGWVPHHARASSSARVGAS